MQSEDRIEKAIDKAVASLIDEHPMGHWHGDQVKEVARRAIAALSTDAEPVAYVSRKCLDQLHAEGSHVAVQTAIHRVPLRSGNGVPLYSEPVKTAPAVAVKALEWNSSENVGMQWAESIVGQYRVHEGFEMSGKDYGPAYRFPSHGGWTTCDTLDQAKAAAQANYEARILSALSAQVQDVADVETTTRFHIEWIAGARPPVHPNPMTGRTAFETFDRALKHMKSQVDDAQFVSLHERQTTVVTVDRTADMRAMLAAAPAAKQEG